MGISWNCARLNSLDIILSTGDGHDIVEGRKTRVDHCLHVFIASNFIIVP